MERDIHRSRDDELYSFSSSEPDRKLIPPAQGETANFAIYSLKKAYWEVVGISEEVKRRSPDGCCYR